MTVTETQADQIRGAAHSHGWEVLELADDLIALQHTHALLAVEHSDGTPIRMELQTTELQIRAENPKVPWLLGLVAWYGAKGQQ